MSRRKSRVLAFQALYSYDVGSVPLSELLKLEWAGTPETEGVALAADEEVDVANDFARLLISGTVGHLAEIDALIKKHLSAKWDFNRVNKVSLAILRISVFSLLYQSETAPTIVIDEAIDIAKEYGADDSFKFINAVLDSIRKEITTPKPQE